MIDLDRVPSATKPEQASDEHETTAQAPDESDKPEAIGDKPDDEAKASDEQPTSDPPVSEAERQPSPTAEAAEGRELLHAAGRDLLDVTQSCCHQLVHTSSEAPAL